MEEVLTQVLPFLGSLEWVFMISFIVLTYAIGLIEDQIKWKFWTKLQKRFKVAIIGLLYGPIYFYMMALEKSQIGILFISYLVTFAFHKLLVDAVIGQIKKKLALLAVARASQAIQNQLGGKENE